MERVHSMRRRRRYQKSFPKKCKELCRKFVAFMFSNVGIIGLVVGYATAGAVMFMEIESKPEAELFEDVIFLRNVTSDVLWNISMMANPFKNVYDNRDEVYFKKEVVEVLRSYQDKIVENIREGFDGTDLQGSKGNWSFPEAFLYSLTVITTIGYGNVYPRTLIGKVVTIVYAIIGMPLFLLYLSNIGDILARSFKWIYAKLCLCKCCPGVSRRRAEREKQRQEALSMSYLGIEGAGTEEWALDNGEALPETFPDTSEENDSEDAVTEVTDISYDSQSVSVPVTVSLSIMVGYICSGAIFFASYEDWDFLDGSYFCFISLSTIGFGDLVPGDSIVKDTKEVSMFNISFILCSIYLMLGMALIAMCFNLMQEEVINKIRSIARSCRYMFRCNR